MKKNWDQSTALFGGTFDPPHLGHRAAAEGLFRTIGIKKIVVIPAARPPLKSAQTDDRHRLKMAQINFDGVDGIEISDLEIERALNSHQPSYTFETLKELGQQHQNLAFVMGSDQLVGFPKWHRFPDILELADWVVLDRNPVPLEDVQKTILDMESSNLIKRMSDSEWQTPGGRTLTLVPTDAPAVSSSGVREEIARNGKISTKTVHDKVRDYIKENRLYGIQ